MDKIYLVGNIYIMYFKDFSIFDIYIYKKYIYFILFIIFCHIGYFRYNFRIQAKVCDITLMRSILGEMWNYWALKKKVEKNESPVALSLISLLCRRNDSYYWLFLWEYPHNKEEQRFTMWIWPRKMRKDSSESCQAFQRGQERSERPFFVFVCKTHTQICIYVFLFHTHSESLRWVWYTQTIVWRLWERLIC